MAEETKQQQCDHFKHGLIYLPDGKYKCRGCGAILEFKEEAKETQETQKQQSRKIEDILEDILGSINKLNYYLSKLIYKKSYYYKKQQTG
ncbi:MAG: hypothetical protein QXW34_02195 [Candidatus Methanomethyliaceae archaeon]